MKRCCLALLLVVLTTGCVVAQPLYDYVSRPDAAHKWEKVKETPTVGGGAFIELKMTSQVWQGITWTHQVAIYKPAKLVTTDTAVLLVNGGQVGLRELALIAPIANGIGAPLVYLGDIPNQPLYDGRREDALIAYTFQKALTTKDMTWPLLYPMAKSAVRAMDCVTEFTRQAWPEAVRKYVVTGASKRGWTSWFTGCLGDPRVVGIAPLVYDNLNLGAQMAHQKRSYGVYSSQIDDYTELGLPDLVATPAGQVFGAAVDPYTYRHRMTMPKLNVTGTNDPYWVLDSSNLYWEDLPGRKYLLFVPNAGHGLGDMIRTLNAEIAFFNCCAGKAAFPELKWEYTAGRYLKLAVWGTPTPQRVLEWTATSPTRDFRQAKWEFREVRPDEGVYHLRQRAPETGYSALFGEAIFDCGGREFPTSTTVRVLGPGR